MVHKFEDHESRIWDISSNSNGSLLASASADSTVKVILYNFF
jgi:WD40 repeat protein